MWNYVFMFAVLLLILVPYVLAKRHGRENEYLKRNSHERNVRDRERTLREGGAPKRGLHRGGTDQDGFGGGSVS